LTAAKSLRPALDEYRAALEDARAALDGLRPVLAAIDDVVAAARLEEVDQTLQIIASDMRQHVGTSALRARLAGLAQRVAARRRRASEWLVGRLLGALPWL
jgi:hypothetical protein